MLLVFGLAAVAGCSEEELIGRAQAVISIDPIEIDFDDVAVGTVKTLELEVRNSGTVGADLQASLDDSLGGEFTLAQVPERVNPGEREMMKLSFSPTSPGLREGTLTFTTSATTTVDIPVRGRGVEPAVTADPPVVDFGRVLVGTTATQSVSLTNSSDRAVEVIRASLTPATSLEYGVELERIRLEPGASAQMTVTYTPGDLGMDEGAIVVLDSGPRAMDLNVRVRGQGVESDIVVEPAAHVFSGLYVGQTQTRPFYVRNIGDRTHTVTQLAFASSGTNQVGDLAFAPATTPVEVEAGEALQVDVTWNPQTAGMIFDEVRVQASGLSSTAVVSISGVAEPEPAPRIEVSPPSLNFGQVEVGNSLAQDLRITNAGTSTLALVGAISIQPSGSPYTLQNAPAPGATYAPNGGAMFQVVYTPTGAGVAPAASVVIGSNDPSAPTVSVPLVGEGVVTAVPSIFVDPIPLAFGQVPRGVQASRSVLVRNDGSGPLTLGVIRLTDDAGGRFLLPTPPSINTVLQPTQSLNFNVEYLDNGVVMAYAGMLEIASDDPSRPLVQVPLTATTEPPPAVMTDINVTLTWSSANTDIDLHLVRPGGSFFQTPGDCCFCNTNPDWGMVNNSTDNPFLDRDDLVGPGPETINLSVAQDGEHRVMVHHYSGSAASTVTVEVRLRGTLVATVTENLDPNERWIAGYITWNAATQMGTFRSSILPPLPTLFSLCLPEGS